MSALTEGDEREEFSAKIRRMNAETEKFISEQRKLASEAEKFISEQRKLAAEAEKFSREKLTLVIAALAALVLASAAVGGVITKFFGG